MPTSSVFGGEINILEQFMTLGKKIKTLRAKHNLSQPELAEKIGIEQSYLSKLENDKSVPSNEIFKQILQVFELSVAQFVSDLADGPERQRLKAIADVEHYFLQQQQSQQQHQRLYLYLSSLLIVLATTVFYIGFSKQVFQETQFQYQSSGVINPDEPADVFRRWHRLLTPEQQKDDDFKARKALEMENRVDEKVKTLFEYAGPAFKVETENGYRYYQISREKAVSRPVNAWLQALAVLLFSCGVMGFILEKN